MKAFKLTFVVAPSVDASKLEVPETETLIGALKNLLINVIDSGPRVDMKEDRMLRCMYDVFNEGLNDEIAVTLSVEQYNVLKNRWEANCAKSQGVGYRWRNILDDIILGAEDVDMKEATK